MRYFKVISIHSKKLLIFWWLLQSRRSSKVWDLRENPLSTSPIFQLLYIGMEYKKLYHHLSSTWLIDSGIIAQCTIHWISASPSFSAQAISVVIHYTVRISRDDAPQSEGAHPSREWITSDPLMTIHKRRNAKASHLNYYWINHQSLLTLSLSR